ncbi:MAG TPA: ABC transporter ATP-binding protein [Myxococcota bacterium]|nr:ABC transporter ATP-binding protein [Myxococcota bacterium]
MLGFAHVASPQTRFDFPASPVAELRSVSKRFGDRVAVDELNLEIAPGLCFGLLGPNGAGKTTALRMLYGVTTPSAGTVRVFGLDVALYPRRVRARIGVTLQENVLLEVLSPLENLRIFGRYHRLREPELGRRAAELIELFELGSHARTPVRVLSGGMQRRLAVALSLINQPELLILDEPTTGLDPQVRLALWARIRDLRDKGTTVLLTTHYMDEAERICDQVAILAHGRLRAEGAPQVLVRTHLAPEALEVDLDAAAEAALFSGSEASPRRLRVGRRLFVYDSDVRPHVERVRRRDCGERRPLVVRPTNLEDVFLALTGTSLSATTEEASRP